MKEYINLALALKQYDDWTITNLETTTRRIIEAYAKVDPHQNDCNLLKLAKSVSVIANTKYLDGLYYGNIEYTFGKDAGSIVLYISFSPKNQKYCEKISKYLLKISKKLNASESNIVSSNAFGCYKYRMWWELISLYDRFVSFFNKGQRFMNKSLLVTLGIVAVLVVSVIVAVSMYVGYNNSEVRLATAIKAKQTDNHNQLDNTLKKISQTAQVSQTQMEAIKGIITGYAEARGSGGGGLVKAISETVPNIDTKTFDNLQNIIVASRNTWSENQRELLDLNRQHDLCIDLFPSSFFCSLGGKKKIDVTIVTSTRTENAFQSGKDDDDSVFKK